MQSMKINIKTVVSCAGGLVAGVLSVHADYPNADELWRRLAGGTFSMDLFGRGSIEKSESVIPGAYKELVAVWKKAEDKDGMLPDDEKKKVKLNLLWERTEGKMIGGKPFSSLDSGVSFLFHAYSGTACGCVRLSYPVFGKFESDYEEAYYKDLSVSEDIKKAVRRCTHIISSEAFLQKVLGGDVVDALIDECNKDAGCPSLLIRGYLYPFAYHNLRHVYLKERRRFPGQVSYSVDLFYPLPAGVLTMGRFMDRAVVDMQIVQVHYEKKGQNGEFVKTSNDDKWTNDLRQVADFQVCLRLVINMRTEEIEKAEIYDKFIVDKPLSYFPNGKILFEKKQGM